jgi:hypothetical protein
MVVPAVVPGSVIAFSALAEPQNPGRATADKITLRV